MYPSPAPLLAHGESLTSLVSAARALSNETGECGGIKTCRGTMLSYESASKVLGMKYGHAGPN